MNTIAFFEVDDEDRPSVRKTFPDAYVSSESLQTSDCSNLESIEVVSCMLYTTCDQSMLDSLPNLKLLCTRTVGYDHIDLEACKKRDIIVCNVPDYGSHVIAEHVFAMLLSQVRHIHRADKQVEGGEFDYHGLRGMALKGKTIGIIGTGKIGTDVAKIAHGFGMRILAVDQCRNMTLIEEYGVEYVSAEELYERSDVISLHIPATPETDHIINATSLAMMKDGVIIINTARGSLIDSQALLDALNSGKVAHALLDVLEHEKNFEQNQALIKHDRVLSTPHIAFYADDSMNNMYADCFESIKQWQNGEEPKHRVQAERIVCDLPPVKAHE